MHFATAAALWLCLAPQFFLSAGCAYTSISTRQHQVVFHYSEQRRSEKDLPICEETSVCSVLHARYWLPTIADRLCRCTNNDECPWRWSSNPDNQTMILNNRAQLKFCSSIRAQPVCDSSTTALTTASLTTPSSKPFFAITVRCFCSANHRWNHYKTTRHVTKANSQSTVEEFKCAPLKRCGSGEFCGNVRTDHNSIYYKCSCPVGHLCVYRDRSKKNVDELLYKGPAFKAFCEPEDTSEFDY